MSAGTATYSVKRAPRIEAEIEVPGDKSISHRAILFASLSNGPCKITNFLEGEDCRSTAAAMQKLGVQIEYPEPGTVVVYGSKGQFTEPDGDIYCGNSGTTMRLLAGLLSAQPFTTRLTGDPSLSKRPMKRVITPLTEMGAKLKAEGKNDAPPLVIDGGPLKAITYASPVASAQVKSAILLAGLYARGHHEGHRTRRQPRPHGAHAGVLPRQGPPRGVPRSRDTPRAGVPHHHGRPADARVPRLRRSRRHFQRRFLARRGRRAARLTPFGQERRPQSDPHRPAGHPRPHGRAPSRSRRDRQDGRTRRHCRHQGRQAPRHDHRGR